MTATKLAYLFQAFDKDGNLIAEELGQVSTPTLDETRDAIEDAYTEWVDHAIPVNWTKATRTHEGKTFPTHRLSQAETDHALGSGLI